jgi:hypothetical protein
VKYAPGAPGLVVDLLTKALRLASNRLRDRVQGMYRSQAGTMAFITTGARCFPRRARSLLKGEHRLVYSQAAEKLNSWKLMGTKEPGLC